ncbi:MAG: RIP metalloprotease RseP [Rhodobiaceae bacterium]|nr:RIP metalloprotease RseP [Rhodobiaceae bacterium]MCC0041302.1 RIP metalloprotease RseP [Rhodobiaceae bacterium]
MISAWGSSLLGYVLPFLFVLTIVVFFHELGHFLVARWCGVKVDAFSIGFGPELFGWNDKHGTRWRVAALPLGGYVRFHGDDNPASAADSEALAAMGEEERKVSFHGKPLAQRAAIVAAGPIANFILAIVIFTGLFSIVGQYVTPARVDTVQAGSAAERAGIMVGDLVVSIDGHHVESFADLQRIVSGSAGKDLMIALDRGGERVEVTATPDLREIEDRFGNAHSVGILGISRQTDEADVTLVTYSLPEAAWRGVKETWFVIDRTLSFIGGMVTGRDDASQLGGPIRIAQISGDVAQVGFGALISLTAILSVSIGLLNLFPIPMLDGGHLLFYAVEAVRGRPLSERVMEMSFRIGLALVLMLMLFATWNDLTNLKVLG